MVTSISIHDVEKIVVGTIKNLETDSGHPFGVRHITITGKDGNSTTFSLISDNPQTLQFTGE